MPVAFAVSPVASFLIGPSEWQTFFAGNGHGNRSSTTTGRIRRARALGDHEPGAFRGMRASVKDCMVWVDSCAPTFRMLIVTGSPV